MIQINDKTACCGCTACVASCPKQCITLEEDAEGFLYPRVDEATCIQCGLCEKVCPVLHPNEELTPEAVYAAVNLNQQVREDSSSGGVFSLLAETVVRNGGIVFGARMDTDLEVRHHHASTEEDLAGFRGSKYVQSQVGDSFVHVRRYLKEGRTVLFSGTPCQVAGLKNYLRKPYENLLTVDCLCHGVPSPLVWRKYIREKLQRQGVQSEEKLTVSFRDKQQGWNEYNLTVNRQSEVQKDLFLQGMTDRLFLRPICHQCPFREQRSHSQLTLGDFWGIEHTDARFADNKGTSMVLVNDAVGAAYFSQIHPQLIVAPKTYEQARRTCSMIYRSSTCNPQRKSFFAQLATCTVTENIQRHLPKTTLKSKLKKLVKESINMKIIYDAPGQTCNRLWSYLDTIGWAVLNRKKVKIWHWDSSIKYFDTLRHNPYVSFPLYDNFLMRWLGESTYKKLLNKTLTQRYMVKMYRSKLFQKLGFVSGWNNRASFRYYPRVLEEVKQLYRPNESIVKETTSQLQKYKDAGYFIIGVHLRGGDYRTWEGGKYFFTQEEYAHLMDEVLALYPDKKVKFFLSTNEQLDEAIFRGKPLVEMHNPTAIHDLYTLSLCDRILGPLSTFSRWASFYGRVPLLFIERNQPITSDSQFSVITDFYHFADGREIINLSDKQ